MPTHGADVNALAGGLLQDLAFVQTVEEKRMGYKRAAAAILALDEPLTVFRDLKAIQSIRGIGPASSRVCAEVLESGRSATVERAVSESDKREDIERRRVLRKSFISRARALEVLADDDRRGPRLQEYRGDFQMHSNWSDGVASIAEVADACRHRGYGYAVITDHSYGLPIAGGISMADAEEQQAEIDDVNARFAGTFCILKGIEANILADGSLDLPPDELGRFECVVAAPHSRLRVAADQTDRLVKAVRTPGVHILGHPRGRMSSTRAGIRADWDRVFEAASRSGVAVEIDGDPSRQDLDHVLARRALDAGCLFALDSDAHSPAELRQAEIALAHARLAGIPSKRIVNCWPLHRVREWLEQRA